MLYNCPECGNRVEEIEKDTSTGRDFRFYTCSVFEWSDYIDVGIALWKAYSLADESGNG